MKVGLKGWLIAGLAVPAIGLSVPDLAVAASEQADTSSFGMNAGTYASIRDARASELIGMTVKNVRGENLGKINDLIVDVNNERVYYAVLAYGGIMGLGGKLFAYPVTLFRPGVDKNELALNVDKERLKKAPSFEKNSWPEWGGQDHYRNSVDSYFGPTVTAKAMPNERLMRASALIGKDVDDREGQDAGEIKDLVVNMGTGRVHYAVLDLDNNWMKSDNLVPLSLRAFVFPADRDSKRDLVLNVAKNQLDTSKGIDKKHWTDLDINDPAYQRNVDSQIAAISPQAGRGAAGPMAAPRYRSNAGAPSSYP